MSRSSSILLSLVVVLTTLLTVTSQAQPPEAVRELVELRTESAKHWQNADGTKTAEIYASPVHYKDTDGAWKDIDTTIGPAAKTGFGRSVVKNRFKTYLASTAKGWHEIEIDGLTFSFSADASTSTGTINGNTITYSEAWPSVDLKYQILSTGIKEDIILKSASARKEFGFLIRPGGLTPVTSDRGINFLDKDGSVVVRIPGPFMSDAVGNTSEAVEATWVAQPDGTVLLIVHPDEEWLAKAVYPVTIDPTVTLYPSTGSGSSSCDAYFSFSTGTWNYSSAELYVNCTSSPSSYACIKWDISSIPRNAVIQNSSSTRIELNRVSDSSYNRLVYLHKIIEAWPPNQPPNATFLFSQTVTNSQTQVFPSNSSDRYILVQMIGDWVWQLAENQGVMLHTNVPSTSFIFSSSESSNDPKLTVSYLQDTTSPLSGTATVSPYTNGSTISVDYTGAADIGTPQSGRKKVELWYKKGYSGTWTNSGLSLTTSAGQFTFTPDGDDTYYFGLVAEDYAGNRSATPTGDGDCHTIYINGGVSSSGRVTVQTEYLYPGAYAKRSTVYDENGSKVKQVSVNYGLEGEVLSSSGDVQQASVAYDSLYRVKSLTDPNSQQTNYTYDLSGNLTQINLPGGETVQFPDHDDCGRVTRSIDSKGQEVTYDYSTDPSNLLTAVHYTDNSAYDMIIDYDSVYGRCTSWSDKEGTTSYTYDDRGTVVSTTTSYINGPQNKTISGTFYDDGSLDTLTTPAGDFAFTYDAAGRVVGMTNPFSEEFSWTYLNNNWLETQVSPVTATTYTYSPRGLMTSLTNRLTGGTLLSQFGSDTTPLSYDALGNLLSAVADIPAVSTLSGTTSYTYNTLDELTLEASTRNGSYNFPFAYNGAGNPTTFKGVTHGFDSVKNQRTDTGFVYDANGNPTTYKGTSGLTYDPNDKLITYPGMLSAGYHGGLRAWKQVGSTKTYFLYAGEVPVCEMNASGTVTAVNTVGTNGLLARHEGENTVFYTFDDGGDVTQTLDSSATVLSSELYDAYGNRLAVNGTNNTPYSGKHGYYTDRETGLILATNRYYDPTEGRWLTRDPIGYAGGLNLYGYCSGNPVNLVDPLGLCGEQGGYWSGYWGDVWQVIKGYGNAVVGAANGTAELGIAVIEASYGYTDDLGTIIKGIPPGFVQMGKGIFQLDDPGQFGQSLGGALMTVGSLLAPYAKGAPPSTGWTLSKMGKYGQQMHKSFKSAWEGDGFVYDQATIPGSKLRPDGTNFGTKTIRELKPRTKSGITAMGRAEQKYMDALKEAYGENHGWKFQPEYYDAPWK
jgi:RHS repeat-associated protein